MLKIDPELAWKKIKMASNLYDFAFEAKKHAYRLKYPEKKEEELDKMAREAIERGCK